MNAITQGLEVESQQSQASLFASGSEPASSLELFSQPVSLSCTSQQQHSQNDSSSSSSHHLALNEGQSLSHDEGRVSQNAQLEKTTSGRQSQSHSSRYYMRYLSAVSLPGSLGKRQQYHCGEGEGATPLAAVGGRQGDTVHSKAAFERWKERQQDKLEKQRLIEEAVTQSSTGCTKELKDILEGLRRDVKEALCSQTAVHTSEANCVAEKAELEAEATRSLLHQLTQGQREIRDELQKLRTLCGQQMAEIATMKERILTRDQQTSAVQTAVMTELANLGETVIRPCLHEIQNQVSGLSEQLRTYHCQPRAVSGERDGASSQEENRQQQRQHCGVASTDACVPTLCEELQTSSRDQQDRECGDTTADQPRSSQIKRKRKGQRDHQPQTTEDYLSERTVEGGRKPSQGSTDGHSTPCDLDLTQHSPHVCSQAITSSIKQLRQTNQLPKQQRAPQMKLTAPLSPPPPPPPAAPAAKRKRGGGGRRGRQQRGSGGHRGRSVLLATPRVTRRSQRQGRPAAVGHSLDKGSTENLEECVALKNTTETTGAREREVDVLDEWLDFRPSQDTQPLSKAAQPASRFQRSSEAARRRLAVTEQMSSALAGSDSVLRELFNSSGPSVLSP